MLNLGSSLQILAVDYCHRVGVMNRDIKPEASRIGCGRAWFASNVAGGVAGWVARRPARTVSAQLRRPGFRPICCKPRATVVACPLNRLHAEHAAGALEALAAHGQALRLWVSSAVLPDRRSLTRRLCCRLQHTACLQHSAWEDPLNTAWADPVCPPLAACFCSYAKGLEDSAPSTRAG